ncbi:hypothetical protein RYH80_12280 [Halobaculum sp. MBLA0147]|uniref:hypothetical protein n=1 Tax=Halobaculum sp. MBLA0147 TaxID=3079934 RepID=UPI003523D730
MVPTEISGLLAGAVALGAVHGAEPGHGWPVAAAYAVDRANRWIAGAVAGLVIGTGHLVSSLAVVGVFFLLKTQLALASLTDPLSVAGVRIGSPIGVFAGVLLLGLAVREYYGGGHGHDHENGSHGHHEDDHGDQVHSHVRHDHADHGHADHEHSHGHADHEHSHGHDHADLAVAADEGLGAVAVSAFVLGFAHEEEFEIIAICAGSNHCLTLMLAYALTVVGVITLATLVLVAGFERFEDRMQRVARYFPLVSAAVLAVMGLGFLLGVL